MEKTENQGDWTYTKDIQSNRITISKYLGSDMDVIVPAQINGIEVYDLDSFVFSESPANVNVKRVVLSEGIQKMELQALYLSNIQEVVLPSTMRGIDRAMFNGVARQVAVSPDNPFFFDIDGILFSRDDKKIHLVYFPPGHMAKTYKIPDGTTHVDWYAFTASKNLERVIMPDSVESLDYSAFKDCLNLCSVRLSPNIEVLREDIFYNCPALTDVRVSHKIKEVDPKAFFQCSKFKGINVQTRMSELER
jgi:hypothetical protein